MTFMEVVLLIAHFYISQNKLYCICWFAARSSGNDPSLWEVIKRSSHLQVESYSNVALPHFFQVFENLSPLTYVSQTGTYYYPSCFITCSQPHHCLVIGAGFKSFVSSTHCQFPSPPDLFPSLQMSLSGLVLKNCWPLLFLNFLCPTPISAARCHPC